MGGVNIDHGDFSNRSIIDCLVELSENEVRKELTAKVTTVQNNWSEAVTGWKSVVPTAKYQNVTFPKKKRVPTKDEKGRAKRPPLPNVRMPSVEALAARSDRENVNSFNSSSSPDGDNKSWLGHNIRCVDEDYITIGVVPPWKAPVEPVTYRYVPNNGSYRKNKSYCKHKEDTQEKKAPLSWHQRKLQKEIQRDLKKGMAIQKSGCKPHDADRLVEVPVPRIQNDGKLDRERSKSDATLQYSTAITSQRFSPVPLPALDDPLRLHDVNDKYIESFSSRLSALDDEIKRDAKLFRKSRTEDDTKGLFMRGKIKDSRISPLGAEGLSTETFSIKPLRGKPQLRPLEKITPQHRITEDLGKLAVAQLKYTTVSKGESLNLPLDSAAFNSKNGHLLENGQFKLCGALDGGAEYGEENNLTTAITATKVIPNNKYSITKLLGTGKRSGRKHSDKDSISSQKFLSSPRISIEKEYNTSHTEKVLDGDFFPGISGKHLTVPLVNN